MADSSTRVQSPAEVIEGVLKTWFKDGVENLLKRNSPVLKQIPTTKVEGKEQKFTGINSFGGAVSGKATVAASKAAGVGGNSEFTIKQGQLFSYFSYNLAEVEASQTKKGAYEKIAGIKAFAAAEAMRKAFAAALYGRGYGELAVLDTAYTYVANTDIDIHLPNYAVMALSSGANGDGTSLVVKTSVSDATEQVELVVKAIGTDGNITVTPKASYTGAVGDIIAFKGSVNAQGPLLPIGLEGWLPIVGGRTGAAWNTYIATPFYGVNRSTDVEALAGSFVPLTASEAKITTIKKAIRKARNHGSLCDLIVVNDEDFDALSNEFETTNTFFTRTASKNRKYATAGFSNMQFAMSTSWVDNIYDDPYCHKGEFYILEKKNLELWAFNSAESVIKDGVADNEPGKQNPMEYDDKGHENDPFKLLIDDVLTVVPGGVGDDGESVRCSYHLYATFVLLNPSNAAVGLFSDADTATLTGFVA